MLMVNKLIIRLMFSFFFLGNLLFIYYGNWFGIFVNCRLIVDKCIYILNRMGFVGKMVFLM